MTREIYSENVVETSVNVVASRVQSVRTKNITRKAVRLCDGEHIGVAGGLGSPGTEELTARAKEALELGIEYPFEPAGGGERHEESDSRVPGPDEFVAEVEELLADLRSAYPEFLFSDQQQLTRTTTALTNDAGLSYSYTSTVANMQMLAKPKKSARMIDTYVASAGTRYSREALLRRAEATLPPYLDELPVEPGTWPVCFFADDYIWGLKFLEDLNGLIFGSGSSIFSGKSGEKLFNEAFTLLQTRADADESLQPFFDFEGTVNPDDRVALIEGGVLRAPYTNRAYAQKFNLPLTGAAGGEYDSVPELGTPALRVRDSGRTIAELLDGRKALLVFIAAGGDFTPDGAFATPLQSAYLFDGEKILGKAPDLAVSSHIYRMFGDEFIGASTDDLFPGIPSRLLVMNMEVAEG